MPVAAAAPDRSPIVAIHPPKFVPKLGLTYEQILEIMQDSASPLYSSRQYAEAIISQHFRNTQ
jgi:hypothetical protein